jgi:hypothetical protein
MGGITSGKTDKLKLLLAYTRVATWSRSLKALDEIRNNTMRGGSHVKAPQVSDHRKG